VTSPPQPSPGIGQYLTPLRDLAAYVLVAAPAAFLFVAVISLFGSGFGSRTEASFGSFINLATILLPFAAVVLALGLKPIHPKARLITLAAVVEYAVMGFFGVVFGVLFGVINIASYDAGAAFEALLVRVAWLAVYGLAAYAMFQIWRGVYMVPKPVAPPGVYGRPQQFGQPGYGQQAPYGTVPPAYPGQPGPPPFPGQQSGPGPLSGQQPGPGPFSGQQPGPAGFPGQQPGPAGFPGQQPGPVQPPVQSAPPPATYGQPTPPPAFPAATYGQPAPSPASQPAQQPSWNQPAVPTTPIPSAAPPSSGAPVSPAASPSPAASSLPAASPSPAASSLPADESPAIDRTTKLPDDRPGFGPADADPPRQ
jgi:hypothetical protein